MPQTPPVQLAIARGTTHGLQLPQWSGSVCLLKGSSMTPLQSLSRLSHTSADGPTKPRHCKKPLAQVVVPAWHAPAQVKPPEPLGVQPVPNGKQAWPASMGVSSIMPLQSLSRPSQTSTPPLETRQPYSQPFEGSPSMS